MDLDMSKVAPYRRNGVKLGEKEGESEPGAPLNVADTRSRYCWNTHILQPFNKNLIAQEFILPVICGYFQSIILEIKDRVIHTGIISRRYLHLIQVEI